MTTKDVGVLTYGPIKACQISGSTNLRPVLFLGYLPPVNTMRPIDTVLDQELCFPAEMLYCPESHLAQLGYAVDPAVLFPPEYPYTSGSTRILRDNFADLYREVHARLPLAPEDLVVDIGSNDGTLLSNFKNGGHRVLGIEPTMTGRLAEARGIPTLTAFFDHETVDRILDEYGRPSIVTATNVFAHIHNVHDVVDALERLVGDRGVFISESHYLRDLVETLQYDTIYHEHLRYYSVHSLKFLLESHGFRLLHVRRIPTHGGSIRVYAGKNASLEIDPSVEQLLAEERSAGLASEAWIGEFRRRVVRSKLELYDLLATLARDQSLIYGIGAPSRASTLINYVGLDDEIVRSVMEVKGSKKIGHYVPGTKIPVLEESALYQAQPPYVLLLSWHIADDLCRGLKQRGFRGDFIIPLPKPRIMRNRDV